MEKGKKKLPTRGKSNKHRVLDGILASSRACLPAGSTREDAEVAYFKHVSERAFDSEDKDSGMLLKFLGDKSYASMKPVSPVVEFDIDTSMSQAEQASQVVDAMAKGDISPDQGAVIIGSIANMLKVEEVTLIKDRLSAIEEKLNV